MHPEVARAAITELRRRQLIRVERQALVALAGGVWSNLWGWEREVMRGVGRVLANAVARFPSASVRQRPPAGVEKVRP